MSVGTSSMLLLSPLLRATALRLGGFGAGGGRGGGGGRGVGGGFGGFRGAAFARSLAVDSGGDGDSDTTGRFDCTGDSTGALVSAIRASSAAIRSLCASTSDVSARTSFWRAPTTSPPGLASAAQQKVTVRATTALARILTFSSMARSQRRPAIRRPCLNRFRGGVRGREHS